MDSVKVGDLVRFNGTNGVTVGTIRCIYPVHEGSDTLLAEISVKPHPKAELCNVQNLKVIDRTSLRWRTQSN